MVIHLLKMNNVNIFLHSFGELGEEQVYTALTKLNDMIFEQFNIELTIDKLLILQIFLIYFQILAN